MIVRPTGAEAPRSAAALTCALKEAWDVQAGQQEAADGRSHRGGRCGVGGGVRVLDDVRRRKRQRQRRQRDLAHDHGHDFTFTGPSGDQTVTAGSGTQALTSGSLAMANSASNQDACKGASLTLTLSAAAPTTP
jgi:hypothetical protein